MQSGVRVRFAPSPTGFFHIGSARTALFNWLYARHTGGTFVLRIEDTDDERDRDEFLDVILHGLRWLGLNWDEGPIVGGKYGPYFQSQRAEIYNEYIEKLRSAGRLYVKDGALYFKVSGQPQVIHDLIHGDVVRKEEKDFVVVRSNGKPVFHIVNVIDDMLMDITHVIRGEDHLSNTSKHVELFQAFGVTPPLFAHIPLILKSQGSGKMSKRESGSLVEGYEKQHYIPEAVRNYLCLLGWSPKQDREILSIEELISLFDITDVNKNNARFDEKKMSFFNSEYLKNLPFEEFCSQAKPILSEHLDLSKFRPEYVDGVLKICQEKLRSFGELFNFVEYFFADKTGYDEAIFAKLCKKGDPIKRIEEFKDAFQRLDVVTEETVEKCLEELVSKTGVSRGEYIHSLRFAVSGRDVGPGFFSLIAVLGKEKVLYRLSKFLETFAHK